MTGDSFSFGRYNSVDDWGLMVIAYDYLLPPKRARKITIPGRSGSYDFGAKNWEERTLRMTCTLTRQVTKAEFREIIYALSKKARLRLWNEPDKYYIAELYDPAEVQDYYLETGREFELNFIAEPFAYGPTITTPLENGRNKIAYQGTAETPCMIVLRNVSSSNVQCFEVKKLFDLCYDETHCMLFDADFSPWADYLKAVNRKDTKRALDKELHNCYRFLANELNAIAALMRAGEVDSID